MSEEFRDVIGGLAMVDKDTDTTGATESDVGIIEKAFLMGLGAAVFAKEKADELAGELVKRGQMTKAESESFAGRLANKADEASSSASKAVAQETARVVGTMGLASKKDLERVEDELTEIKTLIASLRPGGGSVSDAGEAEASEAEPAEGE